MTDDELKAIEARAFAARKTIYESDLLAESVMHGRADDALLLVAEVRRLRKQLGEAVAANLCHVSLKADERLADRVQRLVEAQIRQGLDDCQCNVCLELRRQRYADGDQR